MTLIRCIFCGRSEEDYKGTYLIKNDGTQSYYCSSKCRKNHLHLKRDGRRVRWTNSFRETRAHKQAHAQAHTAAPIVTAPAKKTASKKK